MLIACAVHNGDVCGAGQKLRDGANINRSLLALANCINALGKANSGKAASYVPYRNSKLTRLLKDGLSGNSRTAMIATVAAASDQYHHSINTLKYADRWVPLVPPCHATCTCRPHRPLLRRHRAGGAEVVKAPDLLAASPSCGVYISRHGTAWRGMARHGTAWRVHAMHDHRHRIRVSARMRACAYVAWPRRAWPGPCMHACRAKEIKTHVVQNVGTVESHISDYQRIIDNLQAEVVDLRAALSDQEAAVAAAAGGPSSRPRTAEDDLLSIISK